MHLWNDLLFIAPLFVPEPSAPVAAALGRKHCRISGLKFLPRENPEPQVGQVSHRQGRGGRALTPLPGERRQREACGNSEILSICNLFPFH